MKILRKILIYSLLSLFVISCNDKDDDDNKSLNNEPLVPNKELRGAWTATAWGLDWPMGNYSEAAEKALYIKYLDLLVANNMNAIFFQVRPMQGLFYESEYESWSAEITGTLGKNPGWDVMNFLIDEAHKRNIQFHAWFNPYRISTRPAKDPKFPLIIPEFPPLDPEIPADLTIDYETIRMYNPALPEVQTRIGNIVKEFLTKFPKADGVHIDDYFYPSNVTDFLDKTYYEEYGKEFSNIADFRRHNVDVAIKNIHDVVVSTLPTAAFSIAPSGNKFNNNKLYADVVKWSQEGWADIIIPQLYFATGLPAINEASESGSFNAWLHWWSQFTYNNLLMVGYGLDKFSASSGIVKYQTNADLLEQFNYARSRNKVCGSVLYSAHYMVDNPVDIMAVIKEVYADPTFPPYIGRPAVEKPTAPANVTVSGTNLSWSAVASAEKYAIYKSNGNGVKAQMVAVTASTSFALPGEGEYFVTAIGEYNIESDISLVVKH